jgi:hypothetical protein
METVMAANKRKEPSSPENGLFSGFSHLTPYNSALFARTGEILSSAATEIWTGEVELLRLEAEQASRSFLPVHGDGANGKDSAEQWHNGAEKIINQMRTVSDSMRDCSWKLFELYSQNALQNFSRKPDGQAG